METEWPTATEDQLCQECSDEALLTLSKHITGYQKYKYHLNISPAELDEIDNDPRTYSTVQGKFHSALRKWKSKSIDMDNPSQSTATYAQLVAIAKKESDGDAVRHIHRACLENTTTLITDHSPDVNMHSSINTTISLALTTNPDTRITMKEKVDILEAVFNELARKVFDYFNSHAVKIRTFKGKIANMSVSLRASVFDHLKACFSNLDPQAQIADAWLELSSLWDFLNYELLEHVIHTFIPDKSVKLDFKQFIEAMKKFCSATKVCEFIQNWPFRMKKPKEANVKKMVAKTEHSWEQCTLQDIKETTNILAQLLSILRPFLLVRNIEEGCVSIHWYIPPNVATYVESLNVTPESTQKHRILSITIEKNQVYPITPLIEISLRLRDFYKSKHATEKLEQMQPFKLAQITKEELHSTQNAYILRTLRGDKDDLRFEKSPTTLDTLGYRPDGLPARLVLIEGAAGVGKTTFTLSTCIKWANKELLNHITMLFLLPSRDFNVQSVENVNHLVALIAPGDKSLEERLKVSNGEGAAFWLEGWDEIPSSLDGQSSFFEKLVSREILPNAVVIVSSRPWATDYIKKQLDMQPSQHIEIVASVYNQIDWLIELKEQSSAKYSDQTDAFLAYLNTTPAIRGNMHTPLATKITLKVYLWCQQYNRDLPTTVTQLYDTYACYCIHDFLENDLKLDPSVWKSNDFNNLSEPYKTWFLGLSQLALNGLENRQQLVFADVTNILKLQTLGLMQVTVPLYVKEGSILLSYHFNHLTLQEFLAANALSRLSDKERNTIIKKIIHDSFFARVLCFNSGIIKSYPLLKDHMTRLFRTNEDKNKLIVFHWLFEGGDKAAIVDMIGVGQMHIQLHYSWSALDFFVTGYCIAQSECTWTIIFDNSQAGDEKMIEFFQTLIRCTDTDQCKAHIRILNFSLCNLSLKSLQYLPDIPSPFLRHLLTLDLSHNKLDSTAIDYIVKTIHHTPQLHKLDLNGNQGIQRGGAVSLISALIDHKSLKILYLENTNIAEEDLKMLALVLSTNQCLEYLDLGENNLSVDSLHILYRGLEQNNSLKFLSLAWNKLGDNELTALSKALERNKSIIRLYLSGCSISTIGGAVLASSLMTNSTMEELSISHNSLGGEAARKFAELIKHNTTLRRLDMDSDTSLTRSDITTLVDSLAHNRTLQCLYLPITHKINADKRVVWGSIV